MKNSLIFSIFLIVCVCCNYDYYDYRLKIINNTKDSIFVETYEDSIPSSLNTDETEYYLGEVILPTDTVALMQNGKNGWPFSIRRSKNKMLNLFVYSADTLKKYKSIDYLNENKLYRRFLFTEEFLIDSRWIINIQSQ